MLCMLAARDFARRRDRLRLFIMRHRYVGDESRSAGASRRICEFYPRFPAPRWNYANVISVTILMAFLPFRRTRFTLVALGDRATSEEYIAYANHALSCRSSKMLIGINFDPAVRFRRKFQRKFRDQRAR